MASAFSLLVPFLDGILGVRVGGGVGVVRWVGRCLCVPLGFSWLANSLRAGLMCVMASVDCTVILWLPCLLVCSQESVECKSSHRHQLPVIQMYSVIFVSLSRSLSLCLFFILFYFSLLLLFLSVLLRHIALSCGNTVVVFVPRTYAGFRFHLWSFLSFSHA